MSMAERDGFIWFDGKMVPWREATVHGLTHSLHYGMGCFEGERAYATLQGTAIFRLPEHTKRLFNSAKILQMEVPFTQEQINDATKEVIRANKLESAYIRPLLFYGAEGMGLSAKGLKVHALIAAWSWGSYLGQEALEKGIRVKVSSFSRHHVNVHLCKAKATGNYMNSMLAQREASSCGYDEALLLDREGYVAEGSGENIFMIRDGILYTPTLTSALEGITRDTILRFAREAGIPIVEKQLTRDEFYIADEAFFTGTAAEVTPIREIDGRVIGEGHRGPVTEMLQSRYFDTVTGRRDDHPEWLHHVG
ncbi:MULTISPECIES: branched-chain amino acid transaminase [Acidithiobacillus]|jgi:branched-chain amino acid aminotransferase|uniref:Branched-chain-amino-acid aminotransferase n=4 Tax=Acidithiobacillus TaxID=119977 RepID=A0A179BFF6_ACIFR|nr:MULTISPECIES: branched-chain amino acid transaminase [Acidithiobacillus]OYV81193.1 MAG: branched-chain amino acid aminotransferase [Acidithiobacillus ferrivorans]AQS24023.1 branched-chain amino acid aminotransferase [Acidithiobacillus ferriphilus]AQS24024.1 branched-chain amino acid aminotransferase [Acidithiobacillus ferriphilus]MBU2786245.1 branched-chain amino acid transaminase [Acidithiobacillus ferriphilus]MBU2826992.1 branched-chain amino acid transaminase [Acidithiobacillus ferriphil